MVDQQVTIRLEAEDQLTPTLRSSAREALSLAGALERAGRSQDGAFGAAAARTAGGLRTMQSAMRDTTGSASRLERAVTVAGRATTTAFRGADRGLRPVAARLDEAAAAAGRVTDRYRLMEAAGRGMLVAGTAMAAGVWLVVKQYSDFDKAMSAVAANTGATGAALQSLRDKAIELGGATQYSGEEAAQGINELAKAGVSTADILNGGLKGALSLAAAGQMDVGEAAETAASAMTQFGLSGKDIPHIADLLAAGANKAQGSVHDMSMALNQAGLVANATGLSIDETVGTLTAFASAGMTGSDAGTSLKTMLQRLTPQSEEASKTMEALGLSAYDANGNFVGMTEYAGRLQKSMAGLSPEARAAAMNILFGADAVRAANILFLQGSAGMEQWRKEILLAGFAAQNAAILTDNLSGDMERFGGAVDEVVLKSGGSINDLLRDVVQAGTAMVEALGDIPAPILKVALGLGAAATAATLMGGAVLTIVPKALAAKAALGQLGVTAAGTATALSALGKATAVVGVAVLADQLAQLSSAAATAKPPTDQLAGSLVNLSRGSGNVDAFLSLSKPKFDLFGLGAKDAGSALENFGKQAKLAFDPSIWQMGTNRSFVVGSFNEQVKQLDAALTQLVKDGRIDEATTAYQKFIDAAQQQGVHGDALTELQSKFGQLNETVRESRDTTSRLTVEQQRAEAAALGMSDAQYRQADTAELAKKATQSFHDAIQSLGNVMLAQRDAERGFQAAIDDASAALTRNGATLDVTSAKGRENQAALDGIASSGAKAAAEIYNQTGSLDAVNGKISETREAFIKAAAAFGMPESQARALADSLNLTTEQVQALAASLPSASGNIHIGVNAQGLTDAQQGVQILHDKVGMPMPALKAPVMGGFIQAMATGLGAAERLNQADPRVDVTQQGAQGVQNELQQTTADAKKTDAQNPNVGVSQTGAQGTQQQLNNTTSDARNLDRQNPVVTVGISGAGIVLNQLQRIRDKLVSLTSRVWNFATQGNYANGGINAYAAGGIRRERHVAQIAPAGAWRVWAEEETGGEAYIPLARSKRARSMAILEEVAARFGATVVAQAQGSMLSTSQYVASTGAKASGAKLDVRTGKIVVPVTAQVTKVVIPRGVAAPFLYTAGGKWDRSTTRPDMNTQLIGKLFNDRYVSRKELEEAAKEYYEARVKFDETMSKAADKAAKSASAAAKKLDAAQARVSAAEAALARLSKRKGVTAADRRAAQDRLTAARNNLARLRREAGSAGASGGRGSAMAQAPKSIQTLIRRYAGQYKVDPNLVAAVIKQESRFDTRARSRAGAQGLMQLMPGTARSLGVRNPYDAAQNIAGGVKYLAQLLKQFGGDVRKALAAYNAGPARAKSKRPLPKETQRYVKAVTANLDVAPAGGSSGGVGMNFSAARSAGKAAGARAVATNKAFVGAAKAHVKAKTNVNDARAAALMNALSMNGRGRYVFGGGHQAGYYKNKAALAADCSGFVGWAIGHALNRNATGVAKDMLSGKVRGYVRIDPKQAAKVAGAIMGSTGHVVMSLGDGRVIESYSKGKPVRIRKLAKRDMQMAAWNTALGPMTYATAAQITGGKAGTAVAGGGGVDPKTLREVTKERAAAAKAYADALKAYQTPAYVHLAAATKDANKFSRQFMANLRRIRDRGYPQVAFRLMQMGDEDGAVLAASLAKASDKVLRQQRQGFEENAKLTEYQKDLEESLSKVAGPPAWVSASKDAKNARGRVVAFTNYVQKIARTDPTLAHHLLSLGVEDGFDLAKTAAALPPRGKDARNFRMDTVVNPGLAQARLAWTQQRSDNAMWKVFLDNVAKVKSRGFGSLAASILAMGVDKGADIAAMAAKASDSDLLGMRNNWTDEVDALTKRQEQMSKTLLGPLWRQNQTSTAKATAASASFLANIRTIRDRGFPGLALQLMEMGEDDAGEMAAEAAKATTADLTGWDKTHEASKAITDQTQRLLDELRGVGETLNVTVGLATGGEPVVRYTAARPVDARPATVPFYAGTPRSGGAPAGPLLHVENMYAANPSQAATQLETRLGDAVAVSGIGRVI